jgi:hypothetical protein
MGFKLPGFVTSLITKYKGAQQQIVNTIGSATPKGMLKKIKSIVGNLNIFSKKWAQKNIPPEYNKGVQTVITALKEQGLTPQDFTPLVDNHQRAINVSVLNATNQLVNANEYIGRKVQDVVRQVSNEAVVNKLTNNWAVDDIKREVHDRLIAQGITGVRTSNGRMIRLDSYAELVARSTTREATNRGVLTQMESLGLDLVKMSSHATTCKLCSTLQGRVYSISGKDTRFPPLNKAYRGIYANVHPNCRHVISPYIAKLKSEEELNKDIEFSNRSFNIDERTKQQIDGYNKEQAENAKRNADRHQYERYKIVLGDKAPKSLAGFRRMKKLNSKTYQELVSEYKKLRSKKGDK